MMMMMMMMMMMILLLILQLTGWSSRGGSRSGRGRSPRHSTPAPPHTAVRGSDRSPRPAGMGTAIMVISRVIGFIFDIARLWLVLNPL
jgi:hypothetical protein